MTAAGQWSRTNYFLESVIPSWVTALVEAQSLNTSYAIATANASLKKGVFNNDLCDMVLTMTAAGGVSVIGKSTGSWKFANYMGNNRNNEYAAACAWRDTWLRQGVGSLGQHCPGVRYDCRSAGVLLFTSCALGGLCLG